MNKLFLHIGTHKTGTTAFQNVLRENYQTLKRKDQLNWINVRKFEGIKHIMNAKSFDKDLAESFKEFLNKATRKKTGDFVISYEGFSGLPLEFYKNCDFVAKILYHATRQFDTKILVCLRRQDEFLQSAYMMKMHADREVEDITSLANSSELKYLDWNKFLEPYIKAFGNKSVYANPYDREVLKDHSVVDLLNQAINSEVLNHIKDIPQSNVGFSKEAKELAESLNPDLTKFQKKTLRKILHEVSNKGVLKEYNLLDYETKLRILNQFRESNMELGKKYFKRYGIEDFSPPLKSNNISSKSEENNVHLKIIKRLLEDNEKAKEESNILKTLKAFKKLLRKS